MINRFFNGKLVKIDNFHDQALIPFKYINNLQC